MGITLGSRVEWTSQSNGSTKRKEGIVVLVVPKGANAYRMQMASASVSRLKPMYDGGTRSHESYLVGVEPNKVYWPRVSGLRVVDGKEG